MKKLIYILVIITSKSYILSAVNNDKQTVIKIDGMHEDNFTFPNHTITGRITKWSPWSKCDACRQRRSKLLLSSKFEKSLKQQVMKIEEKPCKRLHCLRQWQKKRSRRRMRIIPTENFEDSFKPKELNTGMKKQLPMIETEERWLNKHRIWSKWSAWSKCSKTCLTQRYKVCRKFGRCRKTKKYESALCYIPNTQCEIQVNNILVNYVSNDYPTLPITTTTTTARPTTKPPKFKPRIARLKKFCGMPLRKHHMLKIKGGSNANKNLWPWHVAVVNDRNEVFCGGTLIAPRWVLTAAHCIRHEIKVRINEFDLTQPDGEIEIPVIWFRRHQRFNEKNIDNDIGLLYLKRGVRTPVACLPKLQPSQNDICTVLGWGAKDANLGGHHILQEAILPIVNNLTCHKAYKDYYLSSNMFCAGYMSGSADTCAGDSGGGLMCKKPKIGKKTGGYTVQGITSFGDACGKRNRYGIYTNVVNYLNWINQTISEGPKFVRHSRLQRFNGRRY